jgi:hypothetical protein
MFDPVVEVIKKFRRFAMRGFIRKITLLAAALMIMAVPALSDEGATGRMFEQNQQGVKDQCLLASMSCKDQVDSIHQRIDRIRGEISRGTGVYTADELKRLERQLEEATRNLNDLTMGG